eukprot:4775-Heterococcus_DN1.PRE.2
MCTFIVKELKGLPIAGVELDARNCEIICSVKQFKSPQHKDAEVCIILKQGTKKRSPSLAPVHLAHRGSLHKAKLAQAILAFAVGAHTGGLRARSTDRVSYRPIASKLASARPHSA